MTNKILTGAYGVRGQGDEDQLHGLPSHVHTVEAVHLGVHTSRYRHNPPLVRCGDELPTNGRAILNGRLQLKAHGICKRGHGANSNSKGNGFGEWCV